MSIRRKFSNTSDIAEPLQSIICDYYLWVRWSNIREINGYYIYNGMKGNKLSFVHQQNSNLIIYFHTLSGDLHNTSTVENTYSFFSSHPYFMPQPSIPENREDDRDNEIKLNIALESPSSSSHNNSNNNNNNNNSTSPQFSAVTNQSSNSNSNNSTPCSSPPQSPRTTPHRNPRITPNNSIDEYLYNHWVIKHENNILYYAKDNDPNSIDNEYPPSYGWKYNERNTSSLPKQYNVINFGAPPPGITRIPIIPEPMITFDSNIESNEDKTGGAGPYAHGNFKNGTSNNASNNGHNNELIEIPFDVPVHYIDIVFQLEDKQVLPFGITVENPNNNVLQINNIDSDSMPYKVGLKQGDILISLNEEEITSVDTTLEMLDKYRNQTENDSTLISMTVCRRIYDHIMIIVNECGNTKCNGKYYFHHLDEFNSPVFMQDIAQNDDDDDDMYNNNNNSNTQSDDYKLREDADTDTNKYPMIIRKAHYVHETGESLWTISDKTEDFYVGLSLNIMPPNTNWESVSSNNNNNNNNNISPPTLIFYNGNQKMKLKQNSENTTPSSYELATASNKAELFSSFAPPSQSYLPPKQTSTHYRKPSWKKNQTPWDMDMDLIIEDEEVNDHNSNSNEWKTKYFILYENISDVNETFYKYYLLNKKHQTEIERLRDTISQQQNKFITARKELLEQKRREEDLLDKINSLQTHSRQVSSISALFDDDYKLDIEELQELHVHNIDNINHEIINSNDENEAKKRRDSVKIINEKLDRIALETEMTDLKLQLAGKDQEIRDLKTDVSTLEESHAAVYDSFTSATKHYQEQVQSYEEKLQKQDNTIAKARDSIDKLEIEATNLKQRKYTDIEAELEYNSDSSSEASSNNSDDSIGGGSHSQSHVRRSSKPWMQIKQKYINKQRKQEKLKNQKIKLEKPLGNLSRISSIAGTPTCTTPITPLSTHSLSPAPPVPNNNNMLSPRDAVNNNKDNKQSPFLKTLISQQEDTELANNTLAPDTLAPDTSVMTADSFDSDNNEDNNDRNKLTDRTERLTQIALSSVDSRMTIDTELIITPDVDPDSGHYQTLSQQIAKENVPTHPQFHTQQAHSKLSGSLLNGFNSQLTGGSTDMSGLPGHPMLHHNLAQSHLSNSMQLESKINLLAFRDSNVSNTDSLYIDNRDSGINIGELQMIQNKAKEAIKWQNQYLEMKGKYDMLEDENQYIISSKIQLLNNTCQEISRLKNIINVVLNSPNQNIKGVITQMLMLKSK